MATATVEEEQFIPLKRQAPRQLPKNMQETLAEVVYEKIRNGLVADFAVETVVGDGHRVWLQASSCGYSIWEEKFFPDSEDPSEPAPLKTVTGEQVADALKQSARLNEPALRILLAVDNVTLTGDAWPSVLLAQAELGGRAIFFARGLAAADQPEVVDPYQYFLAIARASERWKVDAHAISADAIQRAVRGDGRIFLAALDDSPDALAATCALDAELLARFENDELRHVAKAPLIASSPLRI